MGAIDDPRRLAALDLLGLQDPVAEPCFDRFTRLAARLLDAPVALVTLIGADCQVIKSAVGLSETFDRTLPLTPSFCRDALEQDAPLLVDDARGDPRVREHQSVGGREIVAYAGHPIRLPDGHALGTLCVVDFEPRHWSAEERQSLADLAEGASTAISQRVHMAEQARSEAHYRRLVAASPYAIYALDAGGRFVELNRAGEALLQRDAQALLGTYFGDVIAPEHLPRIEAQFAALMVGGSEKEVMEMELVRPSGERRRVSVTATTIHEEGRVTGIHGIGRDVTDEHELFREMKLLHVALGSLSQGICITDEESRLIFANRAYVEIMGIASMSRVQEYLDLLATDADWRAEHERIRAAVQAEGQWSGMVWRPRAEDGRRIPIDIYFSAVDGPERARCLFAIVQDASERLERERHLHRAERLAGLGTLVSGVAHELNNPLTAIKGFASLMLMDTRDDQDREALGVMKREADRAAQIVANLRRLARGTQEESTRRERVDLNGVVRHVLQVRGYSLGTQNIAVATELDPALPPVLADRGHLEQILLNLVVNSEQALAGRHDPRITLRTAAGERGVCVYVIDNGPGIPADALERIFDPFFTTKAPGEGIGLGLALVHGMVAEHNGMVHVESQPEKGTTFRIDFPVDDTPEPVEELPAEVPAGAPEPLRVLVVDDEDSIRRTLSRFLIRRGHRVSVAAEGHEALRLLDDAVDGFDVILTDVRMPGLSGDRLLARLRERGGGMDRRVIFMSGDALGEQTADALSESDVPVILKPFEMDLVAEMVEAVGRLATG